MTVSRQDQMSHQVARYLAHFRHCYPEILEWYSRVEAELESGRRSVFVLRNGSDIKGLAITKNGHKAKLCHISVSPTVRDRGAGRSLMRLAVHNMVDRGAREIRVTTDEQVFRDHGSFFCAGGFEVIDWQVNRYRRGASELLWKLDVDPDLWNSRAFSQRWNDPDILPLAKLGQLVDDHLKVENTNREYRHALLYLLRFGGPHQENRVRMLYGLRANELEVSLHHFMLEEIFWRHEHPVDLLERVPVYEKGYL